jgi:hypothetical protein
MQPGANEMRKFDLLHDEKARAWRAIAMLRWFPLVLGLSAAPAWAADAVDQQMQRLEAALRMIVQEQQSVFQRFQMLQDLRRNDERQLLPLQVYTMPQPIRNYDEVRREEEARAQRIRDYQYDLDRLYARYRELEEQKQPLLDAMMTLAQQPMESEAPAPPVEQVEPEPPSAPY